MAIIAVCPGCGTRFKLGDDRTGRNGSFLGERFSAELRSESSFEGSFGELHIVQAVALGVGGERFFQGLRPQTVGFDELDRLGPLRGNEVGERRDDGLVHLDGLEPKGFDV